jgi:DNA repair exonuclease SbcCD nuclease subunit
MGDTHSTDVTYELLNIRIPDGNDVVHLGDVGLGFGQLSYAIDNAKSWLDRLNKLCSKLNINLYLIRGNHDNPSVWNFPNIYSNVFLTQSGDVGIFPNGKKVLFVSGGVSVDRYSRKEGIDYWSDEITPILENVEKCDIMFAHDCPEHFNHPTNTLYKNYGWYCERDLTLQDDCLKQRLNMTDIAKKSEAKTLFGGHFHNSFREEKDGVYYRCLDINELFEFDAESEYKL